MLRMLIFKFNSSYKSIKWFFSIVFKLCFTCENDFVMFLKAQLFSYVYLTTKMENPMIKQVSLRGLT